MDTTNLSFWGRVQQSMRNHPLFYYFLLAFAFSWIITIPYLLSTWKVISGDYSLVLNIKQWVGPALAAVLMTWITEGKSGLAGLRNRIRQWRAGWGWYLFILLGIPLLALVGVLLLPGAIANFKGFESSVLVRYPLYFLGIFFTTGLSEEIGWRGFALPRMQPRFGPLLSTLLLGALWGAWHLIWFFLPTHGGGPGVGVSTMLLNFLIFTLMVVALTVVFTWVFNRTRGSIFMASLLHAAVDAPQLVWIPLFMDVGAFTTSVGEMALNLAYLIVFGALALLILIFTRGKLGYVASQPPPFLPVELKSEPAH